jgi:Peptidase S24-like
VPASTEWGDPLASEELIEVDGKYVNAKRFAATVTGDSCYPALHRGDLTIWESDPNASYGLIVLAQRNGDHGCTVKELVYDNEAGRSRLHPINPDYEDPDDGDGWGVIARLVAVVRQSDGPEKSWFYPKGLRVRHLVSSMLILSKFFGAYNAIVFGYQCSKSFLRGDLSPIAFQHPLIFPNPFR